MRNTRQWVAQHAALTKHHQHEVLDALAQMIEAVLFLATHQRTHQLIDAPGEDAPSGDQHDAKDDATENASGWRDRGWEHGEWPPSDERL
ncbi:MAG TPA: hypothetical protein VGN32_20445 [Ktedonobacterales bacterium]|nr:hypothetical protein [Ktedonobacterales bacterium]